MKIAVTTASGSLGSTIVQKLKEKGHYVIGIARTPEKAEHLGVEIRKGDYNSKSDFLEGLKDIEAVLLVSGMDHPDKRIQQHRNVIAAAAENGVKKIIYTSIVGLEGGNAFSPIVNSNRQTEMDIKDSGMDWVIGRNGLYLEPDLEYLETYLKEGGIINSAGEGLCGYTSRQELADAYHDLLLNDALSGQTYNLFGKAITQEQLAEAISNAYNINLTYKALSVKAYTEERKDALGDFLGTVIGGIYEGINKGAYNVESHFEEVTGRPHLTVSEMIEIYKTHTS